MKHAKPPQAQKLKKPRKIHFFKLATAGAGSILEAAEDNLITRAIQKALAGQEAKA